MIIKSTRNYKIIADKQKRTFAIRLIHENGSSVTYRTPPLSQQEFDANIDNTYHDWLNYLRTYEYYRFI